MTGTMSAGTVANLMGSSGATGNVQVDTWIATQTSQIVASPSAAR